MAKKPKDLKSTLKNKDLLAAFEAHCKKNLCDENLDFYLLTGPVNPPGHEPKLKSGSMTQNVYKRFIKSGAKQEINIDAPLRNRADELADKKLWDDVRWDEVVTECRTEVWLLLTNDTHPKFMKAFVPA